MSDNIVKPPKLMFAHDDGNYYTEYFPNNPGFIESKIEDFILKRRIKKGKELYYWHYKSLFPPKVQKTIDLNFIMHVLNDHKEDGVIDTQEANYFRQIYPSYQKEVDYFLIQKNTKWRKHKHAKHIYLQKDPYYLAYKKYWIDTFSYGPNFKLFYHGVGLQEALDLLQTLQKDIDYTDTKIAESYKMTLDEYRKSLEPPKPEDIKSHQKDKSNNDSINFIKTIYWGLDILIVILITMHYFINESQFYSLLELIYLILKPSLMVQLLFVPPYLVMIGIYKLIKLLYYKIFPKKEPDSETQPEE